jgi:ABC-type branched-subunit amino acid transport system substrate-binding protein
LPNATLKLEFLDSRGDGYGALTAAANTVNNFKFAAAIGEIYPDNTFAMSIAFQYGGIIQCVPGTSASWLSNKRDYPNLFTTGSSAVNVAASMVDLAKHFKVDVIGILVSGILCLLTP